MPWGPGAFELQFQALKQVAGTSGCTFGCFTATRRVCGPLVSWAMQGGSWWD